MYLQPIDPECRKFLKCLKTAQSKSKKISVEFSEMEKLMDMERSDIIRIAAFLEEILSVEIISHIILNIIIVQNDIVFLNIFLILGQRRRFTCLRLTKSGTAFFTFFELAFNVTIRFSRIFFQFSP